MNDKTLEDLVYEYVEVCKEKARFLQEYAGPPGHPHRHMTPEARSRWKELDKKEKEARKKMDEAFVHAIPSQWTG